MSTDIKEFNKDDLVKLVEKINEENGELYQNLKLDDIAINNIEAFKYPESSLTMFKGENDLANIESLTTKEAVYIYEKIMEQTKNQGLQSHLED